MVDVCVAKDDSIDVTRHEGEWFSVPRILQSATLNHPAVQQNGARSDSQDVAGTSYFSCCTKELDVHSRHTSKLNSGTRETVLVTTHFSNCGTILTTNTTNRYVMQALSETDAATSFTSPSQYPFLTWDRLPTSELPGRIHNEHTLDLSRRYKIYSSAPLKDIA